VFGVADIAVMVPPNVATNVVDALASPSSVPRMPTLPTPRVAVSGPRSGTTVVSPEASTFHVAPPSGLTAHAAPKARLITALLGLTRSSPSRLIVCETTLVALTSWTVWAGSVLTLPVEKVTVDDVVLVTYLGREPVFRLLQGNDEDVRPRRLQKADSFSPGWLSFIGPVTKETQHFFAFVVCVHGQWFVIGPPAVRRRQGTFRSENSK
jgi:hypothetical protein